MLFKQFVQQGNVKNPIQRGFTLAKWNAAWEKCEHDETGKMLHEAGIAFFEILNEIRDELGNLYKKNAPKLKNEDLLRYFCALPNRDRAIALKMVIENPSQAKNVFSQTTANNAAGNHLTFPEIADGCVDALQKAIAQCVVRINDGNEIVTGKEPIEPIEFVRNEADLSQAYGIYEEYWAALQWGDYQFEWIDKEKKIARIEQQLSDYEVAFEVSSIRRMRLTANAMNEVAHVVNLIRDNYVATTRSNKKRVYQSLDIKYATDKIKHFNAVFNLSIGKIYEIFPEEMLRSPRFNSGISIADLLEMFRILSLLSIELAKNYPKDDRVISVGKLNEYSIVHNAQRLSSAISQALRLSNDKVLEGLSFLTYSNRLDDIWCHPLLSVADNQLVFLTAALVTPNFLRVVEHWLLELEADISEKGFVYEKNLLEELNDSIANNNLVRDWSQAQTKRVRINGVEEEIDLLVRIGSVIILGEAKSIVGPYSPTAFHRTWQTLKKAAAQAKRKSEFVQRNTKEVFERFGMQYDATKNYQYISLIINSNKMFAGFMVDGVPVCDESILLAYFTRSEFPLFSTIENGRATHHAWLEVYDTIETLEANLAMYFENLPQISETADSFEIRPACVPVVTEKSIKIIYSRAVMKEISLRERLLRKYAFPLKTLPDIENVISKVQIII